MYRCVLVQLVSPPLLNLLADFSSEILIRTFQVIVLPCWYVGCAVFPCFCQATKQRVVHVLRRCSAAFLSQPPLLVRTWVMHEGFFEQVKMRGKKRGGNVGSFAYFFTLNHVMKLIDCCTKCCTTICTRTSLALGQLCRRELAVEFSVFSPVEMHSSDGKMENLQSGYGYCF